jgi:hypothetical protein
MHLIVIVAAAYLAMVWLDNRSLRREGRAKRRSVEAEIDALERQEGGEC